MVRRAKTKLLLRTFKWSGRMRERDSDVNWFPVEYLGYLDDDGKRRSFTVRKEDGGDIPDGYYLFQDELVELVNEASDGGSGRASGSSDRDIERLRNLKVDECYSDITTAIH